MTDLDWNHVPTDPRNAEFYNRIEQWTAYLAAQLRGYGYAVIITPRETDWTRADFPYQSEVDRMRRNVDALQAGFYSLPDWREIVYNDTLNHDQANALEWDLQRIYDWMNAMIENFPLSPRKYVFHGIWRCI